MAYVPIKWIKKHRTCAYENYGLLAVFVNSKLNYNRAIVEGRVSMFGDRLKEARTSTGHTQSSLAELVGTDAKQVWRWETGKSVPEGETIALLSKMLNVSTDYLLGVSDNPLREAHMSDLSERELEIIMALRRDDLKTAMRAIVSE